MGAEATTSINVTWAKLEGQVVDGRFPLRRFLGSSEHSGVFLVESAKLAPSEVALKVVSIPSARVELQLARWHTAAAFMHPNLMRLLEVGRCSVAGVGNLFAVMEYADQDLAQLLQRRALTEEETREMLVPMLSALAFLHERKLVLGRMKPSNILVVGDQLKLASDAIRSVGEVDDTRALCAYDPPEARDGVCSTASDIWALGVTICEALTRRQPLGLLGYAGAAAAVVLPPDLPPAFREIVAWCLKRQPEDRPEVAEIDAWLSGQPVEVATAEGVAAGGSPGAAGSAVADGSPPARGSVAASEPLTAGGSIPARESPSVAESSGPSALPVDAELAAGLESPAPTTSEPATPPPRSAPVAPSGPTSPRSASAAPTAAAAPQASHSAAAAPSAPTPSRSASPAPAMPPASHSASTGPAAPSAPRSASPTPAAPTTTARAPSGVPAMLARSTANSGPAAPTVVLSAPAAATGSFASPESVPAATNARPIEVSAASVAARALMDEVDVVVHPRRSLVTLALGVVVVIAVVWCGIRLFGVDPTGEPGLAANESRPAAPAAGESTTSPANSELGVLPPPQRASAASPGSTPAQGGTQRLANSNAPANASVARNSNAPASANSRLSAKLPGSAMASAGKQAPALAGARSAAITPLSAGVHEVIPDVPQRARQTIRGTVRVSIRVLVEQDGTVFAALTENRGPSRYFERLAIEAAKQWTFPPADTTDQRLMLVKFGFTRNGTSAEAVPLM